eukprot:TRINITY_DN4980_c2_g2_i1.p3 TRINITY_DN4980_c2_g2~~TRINITY_DN4980_c2_g2_i1.p3  ORF type:complete len:284 (+),score=49.11 TRINITY_DN4980_c2_g2_i1:93-854(+)
MPGTYRWARGGGSPWRGGKQTNCACPGTAPSPPGSARSHALTAGGAPPSRSRGKRTAYHRSRSASNGPTPRRRSLPPPLPGTPRRASRRGSTLIRSATPTRWVAGRWEHGLWPAEQSSRAASTDCGGSAARRSHSAPPSRAACTPQRRHSGQGEPPPAPPVRPQSQEQQNAASRTPSARASAASPRSAHRCGSTASPSRPRVAALRSESPHRRSSSGAGQAWPAQRDFSPRYVPPSDTGRAMLSQFARISRRD